ncbi:hypothetical protein CTM88_20520 [Photobacterium aquimaris]|jgi:hypothetical protein|uniref:Uncharacterized protein n=1 Tax=Photobacterium aquimaris TaxID=512643 RepID=A0A2T3IEF8_9GAMM|nr:hypothetical protein [Photobacterium aquimaris]OBU22049.1 hypothetical protein AYY20_12720 [Photobacterium aquimaris]PSU22206.1 hypothetical protein CTM88_20520 [Photobacterium aquimaris]
MLINTSYIEILKTIIANHKLKLVSAAALILVFILFFLSMDKPNFIQVQGNYKTAPDTRPATLTIESENIVFNGYRYNVKYEQIDENTFTAQTANQMMSVKYTDSGADNKRLDVDVWKKYALTTDTENAVMDAKELLSIAPAKTRYIFWTSQ